MARHTPGNYVPLDVNYARDVAIRKAGTNAELLYIRSLAYAKGARTSGFVSDFDLEVVAVGMRSVKAAAEKLVEVGLWMRVPDGWLIRSWERWNAEERAASAGGKLGNHVRWHVNEGKPDPECPLCSDHPPIAPRSHPDSPPISPPESQGKGREGKGRTEPKGSGRKRPQIASSEEANAGQVVGLWIESLNRRPPGAVVGQVAKHVKALLQDGFADTEIMDALAVMGSKGLNPSTLPSLVNDVVNRPKLTSIPTGSRRMQVQVSPDHWRDVAPDEFVTIGAKTRWVSA